MRVEPTGDRIPCCVPFCRRTAARDRFPNCDEIICGKHWRMAPASWRRRQARLGRMYRRRYGGRGYWEFPGGSSDRLACLKLANMCNAMWNRCKKAAIEAAGGLR